MELCESLGFTNKSLFTCMLLIAADTSLKNCLLTIQYFVKKNTSFSSTCFPFQVNKGKIRQMIWNFTDRHSGRKLNCPHEWIHRINGQSELLYLNLNCTAELVGPFVMDISKYSSNLIRSLIFNCENCFAIVILDLPLYIGQHYLICQSLVINVYKHTHTCPTPPHPHPNSEFLGNWHSLWV